MLALVVHSMVLVYISLAGFDPETILRPCLVKAQFLFLQIRRILIILPYPDPNMSLAHLKHFRTKLGLLNERNG